MRPEVCPRKVRDRRGRRHATSSWRRPSVCRVRRFGIDERPHGLDDCFGGLDAGLRMPSADAVALIRSGLAHERLALDELRDARRQIAAGIKLARVRDGSSYWAIASAIVHGGAGSDPGSVHRARLELAKRLRQRVIR